LRIRQRARETEQQKRCKSDENCPTHAYGL
jgi:hypothetical protein